jgi:hypothetical protein
MDMTGNRSHRLSEKQTVESTARVPLAARADVIAQRHGGVL